MTSTVEFWLKDWNNLYVQLPVNPESVKISTPFSVDKITIAALGDIATPGERGLKSIAFSSFFPRDYNPSYCEYSGFMSPDKFVEQIEKWIDTRRNIRLIIAGTTISIPCYITSFDIEPERAGAPGDIYYSISLTEYKAVNAKIIQSPTSKVLGVSTMRPSSATSNAKKTHTVIKGDTLWALAKKYYGNGSKSTSIYNANKTVIGKDKDLIIPGQKLVIP